MTNSKHKQGIKETNGQHFLIAIQIGAMAIKI